MRPVASITFGALVAIALLSGSSREEELDPRPNFIVIVADDLGWGDLHIYGNEYASTPNLDRLAKEGTIYTQFYAASPTCSPSRAALLTGRFPAELAIHSPILRDPADNAEHGQPDFLDPSLPTITSLLSSAGYETAHFGKWHLGWGYQASGDSPARAVRPEDYGIDNHLLLSAPLEREPRRALPEGDRAQKVWSTNLIVDQTIEFLVGNRDKPIYANLWTLLMHAPLGPDETMQVSGKGDDRRKIPSSRSVYLSNLRILDQAIGRLLEKLDDLGLAENTIVLFTSDNGPADTHEPGFSGGGRVGPLRGRKMSLYEGGIRMPFIVRWPKRTAAGRVDDTSVLATVDLLPTIARLAGVEVQDEWAIDGEDFSDTLAGASHSRSEPLFWEWRFGTPGHPSYVSPILAIRDRQWKLLMNPDGSRVELYDVVADPAEAENLSRQNPDTSRRLSALLLQWKKELPEGPVAAGAGQPNVNYPGSDH
jgi:N-acetylgalactosamine-6-sulfatase